MQRLSNLILLLIVAFGAISERVFAREQIEIPKEWIIFPTSSEKITLAQLIGKPVSPEFDSQAQKIYWETQGKDQLTLSELHSVLRTLKNRPSMIIPTQVTLVRPKVMSEKVVVQMILRELQSRCVSCEFKISLNRLPALALEDSIDVSQIKSMGSFAIPAKLKEQTQWVTGQVQRFELVPTVSHLVNMGEAVTPADVRWKRMDTTYVRDEIADLSGIQKSTAAVSLFPGNVLLARHFKKSLLIKRGQLVNATIRQNQIEVRTSLEAKEDGTDGAVIQLKVPRTDRVLSGKVVSSDEVELL